MRAILSFMLLAMLGFIIPWQNVSAESPEWKANTHLLPQYCKDRAQGGQSPQFQKWRKTLGNAFIHMHHYCAGLFAKTKAQTASDRSARDHWLRQLAVQMQYMSGPCQPGCVLYPELHSNWGWALGKQGQLGEAIKHYQLAIRNKPTFTRAYAELSDFYVKYNELDEARKVLEAGLKASPKSRRLKRRLDKLETSE